MKRLFSIVPNLQTYYHFKLDFQKVDQHTRAKWLIHGTKNHKDNQLQSLEIPCRIAYLENLNMTQRSPKPVTSFQSNIYSKGMSRDRNNQGGAHLQNHNDLVQKV